MGIRSKEQLCSNLRHVPTPDRLPWILHINIHEKCEVYVEVLYHKRGQLAPHKAIYIYMTDMFRGRGKERWLKGEASINKE